MKGNFFVFEICEKVLLCGLALFFFCFVNGQYSVPYSSACAWGILILFIRPLRKWEYFWLIPILVASWIGIGIALWGMAPTVALNLGLSFLLALLQIFIALIDKLAFNASMNSDLQIYVAPFASVTILHILIFISPYGSMVVPGTEIAYHAPAAQLMVILGLPGIFFLSGWISSVIALIPWKPLISEFIPEKWSTNLHLKEKNPLTISEKRRVLKHGGSLLLFLCGLYFFGSMALMFDPANNPYTDKTYPLVRVGGMFLNTTSQLAEYGKRQPREWRELALNETIATAQGGAKIIMWNEWALLQDTYEGDDLNEPCNNTKGTYCSFLMQIKKIARDYQVYILPSFLLDVYEQAPVEGATFNTVVNETNVYMLISPKGEILWTFLKRYPVAGTLEDFVTPGDGKIVFADTEYGRITGFVCADVGYPILISQAGRNKIDILLEPSEDWSALYRSMTPSMMLRAVENGMSIVRMTAYGQSAGVTARGNTIWTDNYFGHTVNTTLCGDYHNLTCHLPYHVFIDIPMAPGMHRPTLYPWLFEVHAYLCYAVVVIIIVASSAVLISPKLRLFKWLSWAFPDLASLLSASSNSIDVMTEKIELNETRPTLNNDSAGFIQATK